MVSNLTTITSANPSIPSKEIAPATNKSINKESVFSQTIQAHQDGINMATQHFEKARKVSYTEHNMEDKNFLQKIGQFFKNIFHNIARHHYDASELKTSLQKFSQFLSDNLVDVHNYLHSDAEGKNKKNFLKLFDNLCQKNAFQQEFNEIFNLYTNCISQDNKELFQQINQLNTSSSRYEFDSSKQKILDNLQNIYNENFKNALTNSLYSMEKTFLANHPQETFEANQVIHELLEEGKNIDKLPSQLQQLRDFYSQRSKKDSPSFKSLTNEEKQQNLTLLSGKTNHPSKPIVFFHFFREIYNIVTSPTDYKNDLQQKESEYGRGGFDIIDKGKASLIMDKAKKYIEAHQPKIEENNFL